ncbi:MAG: component of SufBCD complex [Rhodobacteraceae bacterium]|nr:component of SufBCD complex [Paracoccaceae bacterium]
MDWHATVFELIDMRSFSNLWYWIALAVLWSTSSHWVLGVPFDLIQRARRQGGQTAVDVADLVRINAGRYLYIARVAGLWVVGFGTALLTGLGIVGFVYGVEFCQAVFLLGAPMVLVGLWSVRTSLRYERLAPEGETLYRMLRLHRLGVQLMGICAIFVTAMWGMWQNLEIGVLGG